MQLNFGQAKQTFKSYINNGTCNLTDAGTVLNQVCERIYECGKWKGLIRRLSICHTSDCLTLPYSVESILEISGKCGQPINLNSQWYEFLPGGPWQLRNCNKWCDQAVPRNYSPTIFDICEGRLLRVYADLPEADGAQILIQGYDSDGNRVRTLVDGEYVDGEYIDLNNATPQLSTITWGNITAVQKPLTVGAIRVYTVDPADTSTNEGLIGQYQPNETNPSYQRIHISGLCASPDNPKRLTMLVKMKHVQLVRDTDEFPITSFQATQFFCQAMFFYGAEQFEKGQFCENKAIEALDQELKQALGGERNIPRIKFAGTRNRPLSWQPR